MAALRSEPLFASPVVRAATVRCGAGRSGCGAEECPPVTTVALPRRGVFAVHRRGGVVAADPTTVLVFAAGEPYRVSHPADGGDDCLVLAYDAAILDEALHDRAAASAALAPATQFRAAALAVLLAGGRAERLEAEEAAVTALGAVAADLGAAPPAPPLGPAQRRRAEAVRAMLAADPAARWTLDAVARAAGCSPFHLARQFRAATGQSVAGHLLRLRLALALERMAEGETALGRLAVELGFAHHSHFSARFRAVFGMTPSAARDRLTAPRSAVRGD